MRDLAPLILRLFFAFVLIYGTLDNVLSAERMHEFERFLGQNGFPYPQYLAYVGVYAQFLAGICFALGLFLRYAAAVMVVNWIVAIAMVHWGLPFQQNIAVLAMLVGAVFFLLYGAPRYSVDAWRERRVGHG